MSVTNLRDESAGQEFAARAYDSIPIRTADRWEIWSLQAEQGIEPCFATERRFTCTDTQCPWRDECLGLQAEWRR